METTTYSHPDSNSSSPLSPVSDTPPLSDYKVKFMCSYGGTIQPRPHDNTTLSYVGGDTKIISLPRSSSFSSLLSKLPTPSASFKYQLPGHDLDSLISVTNDDDLHHLMSEYDRLSRSSPKPARLRIFLFPQSNSLNSDSNWFVHALNSVSSSTPPTPPPPNSDSSNPDFLFGLDPVAPVDSQLDRSHIHNPPEKVSAMNYWPPLADQQLQQPFYVFQSPAAGVYHQNRNPAVDQAGTGQAYCSVQSAYNAPPQVVSSSVQGYAPMGYDSAGRPVYYGVAPPQYQVVNAAGGAVIDGGKAVQTSAV